MLKNSRSPFILISSSQRSITLLALLLAMTEFHQKEPCLTLTLMVERQDTNPDTTLIGYIMEFWKFDLTWKLKCPIQQT